MVASVELSDALVEAGYRLTAQRSAVADFIASRDGHFTANDLIADSRRRRQDIARATIFRSLDLLVELGLVERLDLPSGEHAYVRCEAVHHHHLVCSSCGRSVDASASGLSKIIEDIGRRSGFRIQSHRLELFGICPTCQARPAKREGN